MRTHFCEQVRAGEAILTAARLALLLRTIEVSAASR
jgi:hypothetical protein